MCYGLKILVGNLNSCVLDSDLLSPIRTLERTLAVRGSIFHTRSNWNPSYSKFAGSENPGFTSTIEAELYKP
jgi:hypothetical protein